MEIYAVTYTVGYESGFSELIGLFSSEEKAKKAISADYKSYFRSMGGYKINKIPVDKSVNMNYAEW